MTFVDCSKAAFLNESWNLPSKVTCSSDGYIPVNNWKINELTSGKPIFWKDLSVLKNSDEDNAYVHITCNSKAPDGPRASGIALVALLKSFGINRFPRKIFIDSTSGFGEKVIPLFLCLSKPALRNIFLSSFNQGRNIIELGSRKNHFTSSRQFEEVSRREILSRYSNFTDISEIAIQAGKIPKRKNLKVDGLFINGGKCVLLEAKEFKNVDFAYGITQLIQNFMLLKHIQDLNKLISIKYPNHFTVSPISTIDSWLTVLTNEPSANYDLAMEFLSSNKEVQFYVNVNEPE